MLDKLKSAFARIPHKFQIMAGVVIAFIVIMVVVEWT